MHFWQHQQSIIKLEFKSLQDEEYMGHSTETETAQTQTQTISFTSV